MKAFRYFIDKFELVDKYRNEYSWEAMRTWTNRGGSATPIENFYSVFYSGHRLDRVRAKLDKPKVRFVGYWKLNATLFAE